LKKDSLPATTRVGRKREIIEILQKSWNRKERKRE
jgi:hypothetical protein